MYRWVAICRDGKRLTGTAQTADQARDAALRAGSFRGEVFVYDLRGELLPWCSVDEYMGDGQHG